MPEVTIDYAPRKLQMSLHNLLDTKRWVVAVCHRRFGKTVLAVNHLQKAAITSKRERPRFHYIAPTFAQGKSIAWDYFKHFSAVIPGIEKNESELRVNYPNGAQIQILGADNPDRMRGMYSDGTVFDEYGLQPPNVFTEVMRPALSDRKGWALFVGTPNGRNQFQRIAQEAQANATGDWAYVSYKASETGYVDAQELTNAKAMMTADEYAQEYECSFEAAIKGAIYSAELQSARDSGRIGRIPSDPVLTVDTDWDLGVGDATAIWFSQSLRSGEVRVIDFYEASGEGLPHYAQVLKQKGYVYGTHYAPHDIQVKEFASGRSRLEAARSLGITFSLCPNVPVEEGIHAARMLFPKCWFNEATTRAGLDALQAYRRDYNTRLNEFKAVPVHDWSCFHPDTKVWTRHGMYRIMDLPEYGEVMTPCGWKPYLGPKQTRKNAQLVEVTLDNGATVRCTPDHQWLTANGWISAQYLQPTTEIQSCSIHSLNISKDTSIDSGRVSGISRLVARDYIARFGPRRLGQFLMDAISITETTTQLTTSSRTWNVCLPVTTVGSSTSLLSRIRLHSQKLPNGIGQTWDASGISAKPSGLSLGRSGNVSRALASTAKRWWIWLRGLAGISRSSAVRLARPLRIVRVEPVDEIADTWCINVPDGGCFALANGAIVSNSHAADAFRYLAVRQQAPVERRQSNAPPPTVGNWWG